MAKARSGGSSCVLWDARPIRLPDTPLQCRSMPIGLATQIACFCVVSYFERGILCMQDGVCGFCLGKEAARFATLDAWGRMVGRTHKGAATLRGENEGT